MKSYWQKIQLIAVFGITLLGIIGYSPMIWMTPVAATPKKFPLPPDRSAPGDRKTAASRVFSPPAFPPGAPPGGRIRGGASRGGGGDASRGFSPPVPPPDRGAAGDRGGAASRGCGVSNQSVIALVPIYEERLKQGQTEAVSVTKVWGFTAEKSPTFWFFVPYKKSTIDSIEFVLKDESIKPSQTLYRTIVTIPEVPGIISIPLSANTPPLQADKMYHWFFKIKVICNPQQPVEQEYVEGWVQRVNLNPKLVDSLKQATPPQRVNLYAQNGIWYDALTTLAELRLSKPEDPTLAVEWMNLLKSVDLENLAKQPLIECCQANAK